MYRRKVRRWQWKRFCRIAAYHCYQKHYYPGRNPLGGFCGECEHELRVAW